MSKNKWSLLLLFAGIASWVLMTISGCGHSGRVPTKRRAPLPGYSQQPRPPDWANYTISLQTIQGSTDESLAHARQVLQQIQEQTGWRDLHVVQSDQLSLVCRGYFKEFGDDKAKQIRQQVRSYRDPQGELPFRRARFAHLPRQEKKKQIAVGPPKWDLRRAPGNASLCIGSFIKAKDCKNPAADAVKLVKKLRDDGVEAWYYHGQYRSGVYVGHFNADWEWVTTGKTRAGQLIRRLKLVSHDPQFALLRKKFPVYAQNGKIVTHILGKQQTYDASMLITIPKFDQEITDAELGLY